LVQVLLQWQTDCPKSNEKAPADPVKAKGKGSKSMPRDDTTCPAPSRQPSSGPYKS